VPTVFFCSVHSPPITQVLVAWRCVARRRPLRAVTSAASRAACISFVCASARSTRGSARPLAASLFLQSGLNKPARPIRKNSAAAARPPSSFGSFAHSRSLPPPMRGHAVCSGRLSRCPTFRSGKRRARAPGNRKGMSLLLLPAARPRALVTAAPQNSRECPRRVTPFAIAREKECDRARGKRRATPLLHCLLVRVVRPHVSTRPRGSCACRLWLRLRPRLKLSWPAAPWLRAFPRARFSRRGRASLRIAFVRSTQLSRALGASGFRIRTLHHPTLIRRVRRRSATASRLHVSPSPRAQRRRRAPHATARASAARCSQGAASQHPAPRLPPRPPPRSLGRGSRRRAPTSRGCRHQLAYCSAESAANCLASATSGMTGAPLPLVAVRLAAIATRIGAARFPLAVPRAHLRPRHRPRVRARFSRQAPRRCTPELGQWRLRRWAHDLRRGRMPVSRLNMNV
jgi:hypothetical protein